MSDNYRLYPDKTNKTRTATSRVPTLGSQLEDLLKVVKRCERMWALEERIERSLG